MVVMNSTNRPPPNPPVVCQLNYPQQPGHGNYNYTGSGEEKPHKKDESYH